MSKYSFKKYQPASLRLWHWLNALVIVGLLLTVLLRKTLLSWRANSALIQEKLNEAGTAIAPEMAREIAVAIRNPLWDWHVYLGFALTTLLIGKILVAVFIEKKAVDVQSIKNIFLFKRIPNPERKEALHYSFVKTGYAVFYIATAVMVVTGLLLNFEESLKLSEPLSEVLKETHEIMMWFFVVFIGGHLAGVVLAENGADKGLVSDMINGGDTK